MGAIDIFLLSCHLQSRAQMRLSLSCRNSAASQPKISPEMFSSLAVLALAAVCLVLVGSLAPPQRKRETSPAPNTALSVTLPLSVPISAHTLERSLISFSIEGKPLHMLVTLSTFASLYRRSLA